MNIAELEEWSVFACEALQEFCDEAQIAAGNPDGEDQLLDIRALLADHSRIMAGQPRWFDHFKSIANAKGDAAISLGETNDADNQL